MFWKLKDMCVKFFEYFFFFFYFYLINRSQIVECLSSIVRDDTLKDTDHTISEDCRKQLKVELLERVSG